MKKCKTCKNGNLLPFPVILAASQGEAEAIGKELGVRIENINPMNYDWENEMLSTARAIAGK